MNIADRARKRLAGLIEMRGWSRGQLASKSGVPRSNITKFLSGIRHDMGFSSMAKLASAFGVSLDWLAGMPKQNPKELEPDEAELLKLYGSLPKDGKDATLDTLRVLIRFMGGIE